MIRVRTNFPVADVRPVIEEFDNGQVVRRYNLGEPRGVFFGLGTPLMFHKGDNLTIEYPYPTTSVFRRNTVKTIDIWDVTQV